MYNVKEVLPYINYYLSSKSIESLSLPLECIDYVESSDGLSLGVLSVGDCISYDSFKELFENIACFLIDEGADSLHAASPGESSDCWLSDAQYVFL